MITNASQRSRRELKYEKLEGLYNFDKLPIENLYTAAYMTAEYTVKFINSKKSPANPNPAIYMIGQPGFREEIKRHNIRIINESVEEEENEPPTMSETEYSNFALDETVVAVVAG